MDKPKPDRIAFRVAAGKHGIRVVLSKRNPDGPWWFTFWHRNRKTFRTSGETQERKARAVARAAVLAACTELVDVDDGEGGRLARARDAWLASKEGASSASGEATGQYLRNRLEAAFLAGWKAKAADAMAYDMKQEIRARTGADRQGGPHAQE